MSGLDVPVFPHELRQHLDISATTLRDHMKAGKIPRFDKVFSQKTRYWHRSTLVAAGFLEPRVRPPKEDPKPTPVEKQKALGIAALCLLATDIRARPGVYMLLNDSGHPVYIGQSSNVTLRISRHYDKEFSVVKMIEIVDKEERIRIEADLIKFFDPEFNIALTSRAENGAHESREQNVLGR